MSSEPPKKPPDPALETLCRRLVALRADLLADHELTSQEAECQAWSELHRQALILLAGPAPDSRREPPTPRRHPVS